MGSLVSCEDHKNHQADLQECSVFSCMAALCSEFFQGIPADSEGRNEDS